MPAFVHAEQASQCVFRINLEVEEPPVTDDLFEFGIGDAGQGPHLAVGELTGGEGGGQGGRRVSSKATRSLSLAVE